MIASKFFLKRITYHFFQNCSKHLMDHQCSSEEEVGTNIIMAIFSISFPKSIKVKVKTPRLR